MTNKIQISQSIKIVQAALITHLDSIKRSSPTVFDYHFWRDQLGIHHFYLSLREDGFAEGSLDESNLGTVRLRPLGQKLTEMVMEDSVWLQRAPSMLMSEWGFEDKPSRKERDKRCQDFAHRLQSVHREIREYLIEALQEDRLLPEGETKGPKVANKQMSASNIQTRVFINYAHEDIENARRIYRQLKEIEGISPWFDKESLLPGVTWRPAIKKAIREADFFVALLSKRSVNKRGYVQTEMKEALEIWSQFPEGRAYLLPIRLEECEPSYEKLRDVQIQDLFPNWDEGFQKVLQVIGTVARPEISLRPALPTGYEYRCAIVDFDNGLPNLGQICQRLNSIQSFFHFSFPSLPYENAALREFEEQHNFYVPALPKSFYRQKSLLNADLVSCLTKYLLAYKEEREFGYNFLSLPSDIDDTFLFISTHGLYELAKKAGCTFEKGIVYHILTQLLIHFASGLGFHDEVRGCILDYCEDHSWMVKGLKKMRLCPDCAGALENKDLEKAVLAILADPLKV